MTAKIIDGTSIAKELCNQIATQVASLTAQGISPGLAVILVGEDPASQVYVNRKVAACQQVGMHSLLERYPAHFTENELLTRIQALNVDPLIHGILVQLPLPAHLNPYKVIESIAVHKDVDGFHMHNAGLLFVGQPLFRPCTPYGILKLLEHETIDLVGMQVVVVGASNIVGKPMAMLLLDKGATVTICHSKTRDLIMHTRAADVLVVAAGKQGLVRGDMIKPGATVIDVGIHRGLDGKICGDVDFASAHSVAGAITPVPGGVGPMTIAMLLSNTIEAAQRTL